MKYVALLLAALLTGCTAAPSSSSQPPAPTATVASTQSASRLERYHWQITSATDSNGRPIPVLLAHPEGPLQLDFSDGRIFVKHLCNAMSSTYRISNGQLHVAPMMHTMMACGNHALMQMGNAIGTRLRAPLQTKMTFSGETPRLTLTTAAGDMLTFSGAPADNPQ